MSTAGRARARNAIFAIALSATLLVPAVWERPSFTGVYVASAYQDGARHGGGWDFAPLPGVRVGLDADTIIPLRSAGGAASSFTVGSRVGAVIGGSRLVYVRAGYARRGPGRSKDQRGLLLSAGVETIADAGTAIRHEYRLASPAPDGRVIREETYHL
jgi:hypothetical protein